MLQLNTLYNMDCLEGEVFEEIKEYPNYLISNMGRIFSKRNEKLLQPQLNSTGYYIVSLSYAGRRKSFKIHRLVAKYFLPFEGGKIINHINGNKLDNRAKNLEYATYSENLLHAYKLGLNPNMKKVACYSLTGELIKIYPSARSAEKDRYKNQLIAKCCKGKIKSHNNKIWKYA